MEPAKIVPTYSGFARFMAAGHMRGTGPFILAMVTAGYLFRGILKPQDYSAVSNRVKAESRWWKFYQARSEGKTKSEAFAQAYGHKH
jgi:hypothetical protein